MSVFIRRLTIENFGPYLGRHLLEFGARPGVWVIYGENGRGKTSILNAFRFALYGEVLGRLGQKRPQDFVNRRHAEEVADARFTLQLDLEMGPDLYQISRSCSVSGQQSLVVKQNNSALSVEGGRRELERMFPPKLADFFLFDGEMLQRYEQLGHPGSAQSDKVRSEVERLLGVTAVEEAREHLDKMQAKFHRELQRVLTRADTGDDKSNMLAQLLGQDERLAADRELIRQKQARNESELKKIEQALEDQEEAQRHLREIESLQNEFDNIQTEIADLNATLSNLAPDLWKSIVGVRVKEMLRSIRSQAAEERTRQASELVRRAIEVMARGVSNGQVCPVCSGVHWSVIELDNAVLEASMLADAGSEFGSTRSEATEDALDQILASSKSGEIRIIRDLMDAKGAAGYLIHRNIQTANTQLLGINREEVRKLVSSRDSAITLRNRINSDLKGCEKDLENVRSNIDRVQAQITEADSAQREIGGKISLCRQLTALFDDAREEYKTRTLREVKERASSLFVRMRAETAYAGLTINENYGLSIVDSAGEVIPNPSAGYEHLVALSLIGALQGIAPMRSPVVIDSPFHRLDPVHTRHSVSALPELAEQVILLTFSEDFNRVDAQTGLGPRLVDEYRIERRSALESHIVQGFN